MSQENEQVMEAPVNEANPQQEPITPIFDEVTEMTESGALNVLVQAAGQAQASGALTVRDSVMVAKAISILSPGSI